MWFSLEGAIRKESESGIQYRENVVGNVFFKQCQVTEGQWNVTVSQSI